ncbi:hypothetical protein MNBD_NITROSPINAE02-1703 [hydrothermal vent metagenome]|uniref:Dodecin (COG3360) Flavin-binding n=1 Tax=hydrothermal vent metagenome TaxID=652676 RepID=A0A3B1CJC9_9ZZZZ
MGGTFKFIRLVGTSEKNYEDAIANALSDARASLRGLNWYQVVEQRGAIDEGGKVSEYQIVLDVAFKIDRS